MSLEALHVCPTEWYTSKFFQC